MTTKAGSKLDNSDIVEMYLHDEITVEELKTRLEERRKQIHELLALLGDDVDLEQYAPCQHMDYIQCPLRCCGGSRSTS